MNQQILEQCAEKLLVWYRSHRREFPWRSEPSPYHVWLSEIMLQQTRIEAAMPYYYRFLEAVPDIESLAALSEDRLLKLWEGLGYYSRARNLQKAARIVCEKYGGELPADYNALLALPGIGEYAAGAIASIAFSIPASAVDGNVMRVLARLCGDDTDVLSSGAKRHFTAIADAMVPSHDPGAFNQAVMELGETICLPNAAPRCESCPIREHCTAYADGTTLQLPVRIKRTKRRVEHRTVGLVIDRRGASPRVLLHRRADTGLLAGMWEFPNALPDEPLLPESIAAEPVEPDMALPTAKHVFSHIEWHMIARLYDAALDDLPSGYAAVTIDELHSEYALPTAFRTFSTLLYKFLCEEEVSNERTE